jgi:hypothetical protein
MAEVSTCFSVKTVSLIHPKHHSKDEPGSSRPTIAEALGCDTRNSIVWKKEPRDDLNTDLAVLPLLCFCY